MSAVRDSGITGRYFIVGSARSGSTLLQAMLASHSKVHSFPETHYFCEMPLKGRRFRWARLVRRDVARKIFEKVLSNIGRSDLIDEFPKRSALFRHHVAAFQRVLDAETIEQGKSIWVEKTPHHIDFIPVIANSITGARFIHIVRDGRDVVASQLDASRKNPEHWGSRSIEEMISLWNRDIATSASYADSPMHLLVSYENLIESPSTVLSRVCEFMSVDFEEGMLDYHTDVSGVLGWRDGHEYMSNVHKPLNDTRQLKFKALFSAEEQSYIVERLICGGDAKVAAGISSTATSERARAGADA